MFSLVCSQLQISYSPMGTTAYLDSSLSFHTWPAASPDVVLADAALTQLA